jgi:hypothetical protein
MYKEGLQVGYHYVQEGYHYVQEGTYTIHACNGDVTETFDICQ